jgi:hypothetical protein
MIGGGGLRIERRMKRRKRSKREEGKEGLKGEKREVVNKMVSSGEKIGGRVTGWEE